MYLLQAQPLMQALPIYCPKAGDAKLLSLPPTPTPCPLPPCPPPVRTPMHATHVNESGNMLSRSTTLPPAMRLLDMMISCAISRACGRVY